MYYTYAHSTPDGKVFYIGKGVGDRAFSKSDRTLGWRAAVSKFRGYAAQILADWSTEDEAFEHEKFLIKCFREMGHELVNQTSGGKGPLDYCRTEEARKKTAEKVRGFKHSKITCPHCGTVGGATSMKRWHFDSCTGAHPKYKARVTIHGVRRYLGKFHTEQEVAAAIAAECKKEGVSVPAAFQPKPAMAHGTL